MSKLLPSLSHSRVVPGPQYPSASASVTPSTTPPASPQPSWTGNCLCAATFCFFLVVTRRKESIVSVLCFCLTLRVFRLTSDPLRFVNSHSLIQVHRYTWRTDIPQVGGEGCPPVWERGSLTIFSLLFFGCKVIWSFASFGRGYFF